MAVTGKHIGIFFIGIAAVFAVVLALFPPLEHNPLLIVALITVGTVIVTFLFGLVTEEYSWTDRLWSTAPIGYGWIYAAAGSYEPQLTAAALLVTLWGARLTFNFARRGGYTGLEDYRWLHLRKRIKQSAAWQAFHLLFIAFYQQFLFICFTLPLYVLYMNPAEGITPGFIIISCIALGWIVFEAAADQQQWNFQQAKHGMVSLPDARTRQDVMRGFRTIGLFSRSRHPNYLGELGFWWTLYVLGAAADGTLHWSILGPLLLTLLFIGSTKMTESITQSKYPQYRQYKEQTWPIFPKLF